MSSYVANNNDTGEVPRYSGEVPPYTGEVPRYSGDFPPYTGEVPTLDRRSTDMSEYSEPVRPAEPSTLRIVIHHTITNGGLILFLICYTCIGAAVFRSLEGPAEQAEFTNVTETRKMYRNIFLQQMKNLTIYADDENQWWRRASKHLKGYEARLDVVVLDPEKPDSWNFYGSMFFATTILTTIGYGNIAPVTAGGRIFCMVYAVFGIALLLLVLASIGTLLARGATLTYQKMHAVVLAARKDKEEEPTTYARDRRSQEIIDEIWNPPVTKGEDGEMTSMHTIDLKDGKSDEGTGTVHKRSSRVVEEPPKPNEPQIPLSIVLVFAFLYICFLAILLQVWEDQWSYFDSFYFSFITLTTIGFGDLVPLHQKNLLGCTFFILLGMAIMSMCIALAQELIIEKVSWLSRKIGVAFAKRRPHDEDS